MRIAVNDGARVERIPPGPEQVFGDLIANLLWRAFIGVQAFPANPAHGQQPICAELRYRVRDRDEWLAGEDVGVERHVFGFARVIELFAQPIGDLIDHLCRVD